MAGTLYMMVGIPGSGKSTFAKNHKGENDIYVSRDEIRFSIIGDNDDYFSHEDEVFNEFATRIKTALNEDKSVWADATHITKNSRNKLFDAIGGKPEKCIAVVMRTPFQQCRDWNFKREGRSLVPSNVMNRMRLNYEEPSSDESFSEIMNVYYKGE